MSLTEIVAIVSTIAFVATAIFVMFQTRHMKSARKVEISMRLFEWSEQERIQKGIKYVEEKLRGKTL